MSSGCGDVLSLADLQTAKKHQLFEAEVITGKQGGVDGGADINSATNQVTGQTQKTMPAVLRDVGFTPVPWDFSTGGTLGADDRDKVVYDPVSKTWYSYAGTLPVTAPAGFNPVGNVNWVPQTDPNLREELAADTGALMIGTSSGILETRLTAIEESADNLSENVSENFVTSITPCATPTIGSGVKAVVKIDGDADFYIISKKANGKSGFIATRITDESAPADSANYGGLSPFRPGSVDNIRDAISAKLAPYAKGASVVLSSFSEAQITTLYGFTVTPGSIHVNTLAGDYTLYTPQVYQVPNGSDITYQLTSSTAKVRFAASGNSSAVVNLSISRDGVNWLLAKTVNIQLPPTGQNPLPMEVQLDGLSGTWFLKIANAHTAPCYVVGVNIQPIGGDLIVDYDNFIATFIPDYGSGPSYYFGGLGATEFAAKEASTGKFFGTYHGAHGNFLQRLRTDAASYNLDSSSAPALLLTKSAALHSASDITVGATSYRYVASTVFGDGTHTTRYTINLNSGTPILCERIYTHMATTCRNFDWIHHPLLLNKIDDGDVPMGQAGFIQQFRSDDAAVVDCTFSQININDNANGAYVSFQPSYNKQYYGPALATAGKPVPLGTFTTCKTFY